MTETAIYSNYFKVELKSYISVESVYLCESSPLSPAKGLGSMERECGITVR